MRVRALPTAHQAAARRLPPAARRPPPPASRPHSSPYVLIDADSRCPQLPEGSVYYWFSFVCLPFCWFSYWSVTICPAFGSFIPPTMHACCSLDHAVDM